MPAMVRCATNARLAALAAVALALVACLAGCGTSIKGDAAASAATAPATPTPPSSEPDCAGQVIHVLGDVAQRVYREGVLSERTAVAERFIATSVPLRQAVERGDALQARAAARALITAGRLTDLRVTLQPTPGRAGARSGERVLTDVGPPALAPLHGTISDAHGHAIASYLTSVWTDSGLVLETNGITEGVTALARDGRSLPGSFPLPRGPLPVEGVLRAHGVDYRYTSLPAAAYPSGSLRIYVLRSIDSIDPLCGSNDLETTARTLSRVASLIYEGEQGRHATVQVRRVQHDRALLEAVAQRDPVATRLAVDRLLHEHVVRLRVSAGASLLADVGGPYVLAPVRAPLRLAGRRIGSIVLSIQDDEGYKRLTGRLAGLDVLMYMGSRLVMNSVGPSPPPAPTSGSYSYRGRSFSVFTLHARAFPSGPLRIAVLIPIPYS
jgi:hypothetical protein